MRSEVQGQRMDVEPVELVAPVALITQLALIASLLIPSPVSAAGAIEVSAALSDTVMAANDSVILTCVVRWDEKLVALLSESPPTPALKRLEIGAVSARSESVTYEGRVYAQRTYSYILRPLRSGLGMISPLQFGYVTLPDSSGALVSSQNLSVRIVIPERAGESGNSDWWLWIALAVGAGVTGVWVWSARSRKSRMRAGIGPQIEDIEGQLRKLRALTSSTRADFYSEAHRLLLHIQAPGFLSSDDVLPPEMQTKLDGWIAEAAREKFAPGRGEPGEALRRYVEIEKFVREEIIENLNRN